MDEKRKYKRYKCKIKVRFRHENSGAEDDTFEPFKGKGHILDISRGGIFIATDSAVPVSCSVTVTFKTDSKIFDQNGFVVRTGLIRENPAEVVRKFDDYDIKEKTYIAVQFDNLIEDLDDNSLPIRI